MNKFLLLVLLLCCRSTDKAGVNVSLIEGSWYQNSMITFGSKSHSAVSPEWVFSEGKCTVLISKQRQYNYTLTKDSIAFSPVRDTEYEEFEEKFMFNQFLVEQSETQLLLTCKTPVDFQIVFRR